MPVRVWRTSAPYGLMAGFARLVRDARSSGGCALTVRLGGAWQKHCSILVAVCSSVCCMNESLNHPELDSPPESAMLKAAYRNSGLTVADLASATGLSVGTVHIALNGIRYRDGKARVAISPDRTLVKLASALRIHPDVLRVHDRARAADLLVEASRVEAGEEVSFASEREAQAAVAGRSVLARQVLAAFSDEELRAELERRDRSEQILMQRQDEADLTQTLTADRWPL